MAETLLTHHTRTTQLRLMDDSDRPPGPPPSARPEGDAKPTPVRKALGDSGAGQEVAPPSRRTFVCDGVDWVAETAGAALAGAAGDAAAMVILVLFQKEDDKDPSKEALIPRRSLDELSELELVEAFEAAVPFRSPEARTEIFQSTRQTGRQGR